MRIPELPLELWQYITQFIPERTLRSMLAVNSFFYNLSMDLRYNKIELQTFSPKTMKIIARLLSHPEAGKRVRNLTVSPDFEYYGSTTRRPSSFRDRVANVFHSFHLNRNPSRSQEKVNQALTNVLPGLPSVTTFTVNSYSWRSHSSPELNMFLHSAWSSFGSQLKKLSLRGGVTSVRTIISSRPDLPMVEELFIELGDDPVRYDLVEDTDTLLEIITPFINDLAPNLKALTILCQGNLDITVIFSRLGTFPLLSVFNFQTKFPKTFRGDPSNLKTFLENNQSGLKVLVLRLNPVPSLYFPSDEDQLVEWLHSFSTIRFPTLQELQIYPSMLPQGLNALVSGIQKCSALTTLDVRERYLKQEEIARILDALPPRLKSLRLNIRWLNSDFFDMVVKRLPELCSLSLHIGNISPTFITDMQNKLYSESKLWNLGIWHIGWTADVGIMYCISRSIPSIHSFCNHGNMYSNNLSSSAS